MIQGKVAQSIEFNLKKSWIMKEKKTKTIWKNLFLCLKRTYLGTILILNRMKILIDKMI